MSSTDMVLQERKRHDVELYQTQPGPMADAEIDAWVLEMEHDECPVYPNESRVVAQAKEANKLRAALAQALDEWEAWAEEPSPGGQIDRRQLDDIAELRKLVQS